MLKFILTAGLYLLALFAILYLFPDDQVQLLHELALDQTEFNQSLPEVGSLQSIELITH